MNVLCLGRNDYGESKHYYSLSLNASDCEKIEDTTPVSPEVTSPKEEEEASYLGDTAPETKDSSILEIALISSLGSLLLVLLLVMAAVLLCLLRWCKR